MGELREFEKIDNYMLLKHHNFDGIDQTMLEMTEALIKFIGALIKFITAWIKFTRVVMKMITTWMKIIKVVMGLQYLFFLLQGYTMVIDHDCDNLIKPSH